MARCGKITARIGTAWDYLPHDQARSKAYRWNEDGLGGICDRRQFICFALALWNGRDPILKERLFGLTGNEGNHGEDVKEYYFYLDSTPTHSYMKFLYKYPHSEFPYAWLVEENRRRDRYTFEFKLLDTGVFNEDRSFDVCVAYAKSSSDIQPDNKNLFGQDFEHTFILRQREADEFYGTVWRGPVWFPMNYLLIESLQKFHYYLGDSYTVECPTGSGNLHTLWEVASDLSRRL